MAVNVVDTTSNTPFGELTAGWSVQEYATPVALNKSAGGTGNISYSAKATDTTGFRINNNVLFEHDRLGNLSGDIKSVSMQGISAAFTQNSPLEKFNCERTLPALFGGGMPAALANAINTINTVANEGANVVDGDIKFIGQSGRYWGLQGNVRGINAKGEELSKSEKRNQNKRTKGHKSSQTGPLAYNNSTGKYEPIKWTEYRNSVTPESMIYRGKYVYGKNITGETFSTKTYNFSDLVWLGGSVPKLGTVIFKSQLNAGETVTFNLKSQPLTNSNFDNTFFAHLTVDRNAGTARLYGDLRSAGIMGSFDNTVDVSALDFDEEIVVNFTYRFGLLNAAYLECYVSNVSNIGTPFYLNQAISNVVEPVYFDRWTIDGLARAIWLMDGESANILQDPRTDYEEDTRNFATLSTETYGFAPVPSVRMNVWTYLQQACAAYNKEICLTNVNNVLQPDIRDVGSKVIDITNVVSSPSMSISTALTGTNFNIEYNNASVVIAGELYNARDDGNKTFKVDVGVTTTFTVKTNSSPLELITPLRTTSFVTGAGTYYVIDSTDTPIAAGQWEDYGADLSIKQNADDPNSIDIIVAGPVIEIPGTTAPYTIGISDNQTTFGALSIIGTGIKTDVKTLNLTTGSDPIKVSQSDGPKISNPFINTIEQAYERGIWASMETSGPIVTLNASISVNDIDGFGLTAGALVRYNNSIYRINDVTIGNLAVSFNASRHVTVGDYDPLWASIDVGIFDGLWAGNDCSDDIVAPFYHFDFVLLYPDENIFPNDNLYPGLVE